MKYWSPYVAGVGLGLVMLFSFYISGKGLGASGAFTRVGAAVISVVDKDHVDKNSKMSGYVKDGKSPLTARIVFVVLGLAFGGLISGIQMGHFKKGTYVSPRFTLKKRLILALIGGVIVGWAAGLSLGCTSSQALSGGALLSVGSWVFMFSVFGGGYAVSYFVRKQWS